MEELFIFLESLVSEQRRELLHKILALRTKHFILVAEDIYQEHNASALVRTCECLGLQEMHIIQKSYNLKIEHGMTRGADKWVDVCIHKNDDGVDDFKRKGYQVVATSPHATGCEPEEFDVSKKSVFYFGREKEGLSPDIIKKADLHMKIPMAGFTESFNVSVSAAIILYELTTKLRKSNVIQWQLTPEEVYNKKIDWYLKSLPNPRKTIHAYLRNNPELDPGKLKEIINVSLMTL